MTLWKRSEAKAKTKSPISDLEMPLPPAGAGIHEKLLEAVLKPLPWIIIAVFMTSMAAMELVSWLLPTDSEPWLLIAALTVTTWMIALWQMRRAKREVVNLQLGLRGERYVAARLEELRPLGYLVTHDLPSATREKDNHFNIDHVIVGPAGVFAVETKAWSKPIGDNPKLALRGERLVRSDRPLHLEQANAPEQARNVRIRVAKILKAATGRDFPVQAILAVPGWWTEESDNTPEMLVLNPKRIGAVLKALPSTLDEREILFAYAQLQNHGRAAMKGS